MNTFFATVLSAVPLANLLVCSLFAAQPQTRELDTYFETSFQRAHFPNAAVMIVSKDEILYQYGHGDVQTFEEQFVIGSSSKSFTALAVMTLVEQGKLDLDAPLSQYLAGTWVPQEVQQNVTVRQLMNQTSGIHQYHLKDIGKLEEAGRFAYSNANFDLLGFLIQTVSGQSYTDYMAQKVFAPIGMSGTAAVKATSESLHLIGGSKTWLGFPLPAQQTWKEDAIPSGYIASTPLDMAAYLQMYLNQGQGKNGQVLAPDALAQMFSQTHPIEPGDPAAGIVENGSYGFAWFCGQSRGTNIYSHGGNVETYSAAMILLPEKEMGLVILVSADDMFAGQSLLDEMGKETVSYLETGTAVPVSSTAYWTSHLVLNLIVLSLIGLCVFCIVRLKQWKTRSWKKQIWSAVLSVAAPVLVLAGLPRVTGAPVDVIWRFATDTALVVYGASFVLLGLGLYKLLYMVRKRGRTS